MRRPLSRPKLTAAITSATSAQRAISERPLVDHAVVERAGIVIVGMAAVGTDVTAREIGSRGLVAGVVAHDGLLAIICPRSLADGANAARSASPDGLRVAQGNDVPPCRQMAGPVVLRRFCREKSACCATAAPGRSARVILNGHVVDCWAGGRRGNRRGLNAIAGRSCGERESPSCAQVIGDGVRRIARSGAVAPRHRKHLRLCGRRFREPALAGFSHAGDGCAVLVGSSVDRPPLLQDLCWKNTAR